MENGINRIIVLGALAIRTAFGLTHPGAMLTADDLQRIRSQVAAGAEPWKSAWNALQNSGPDAGYKANVKADITDQYPMQVQGHAAYLLALKWVASGDMAYANAAKNLINAWVNTVTKISSFQAPLRFGTGGNQMANAAEILAYGFNGSAGWSPVEVAKAKVWFEKVIYPILKKGASSNHGTSCLSGAMGVAIFCDNQAMFDYAIDVYKNGYTGSCNVSVKDYIWKTNGQAVEAGRDQAHVQFGVGNLVNTARMAWVQGVDIVTYADNRVVAGMEYAAKYGVGETVPYDAGYPDLCNIHPVWPAISPLQRGMWYPVWEAAERLFNDAGLPHPYTTKVVTGSGFVNKPAGVGSYRPERHMDDAGGNGTLAFYRAAGPNAILPVAARAGRSPILRFEKGRLIVGNENVTRGISEPSYEIDGRAIAGWAGK